MNHKTAVANSKKSALHEPPLDPHEYHEISDEEVGQSPGFDLGPSLMDEVLRALGGGASAGNAAPSSHSTHIDRDHDWRDESSFINSLPGSKRGTLKDTLRKKQALVCLKSFTSRKMVALISDELDLGRSNLYQPQTNAPWIRPSQWPMNWQVVPCWTWTAAVPVLLWTMYQPIKPFTAPSPTCLWTHLIHRHLRASENSPSNLAVAPVHATNVAISLKRLLLLQTYRLAHPNKLRYFHSDSPL